MTARIHKKKKLPRRERITKLTAGRFSSANNRIGQETESEIDEEKKRERNTSNENATFAAEQETRKIMKYWISEEEEKRRSSREESVRPSTTLRRPNGQTSLAH